MREALEGNEVGRILLLQMGGQIQSVNNLEFKQRAEHSEEVNHMNIGGISILSRGNSKRQSHHSLITHSEKGQRLASSSGD